MQSELRRLGNGIEMRRRQSVSSLNVGEETGTFYFLRVTLVHSKVRVSNEGFHRPRVARAQGIRRLLFFPLSLSPPPIEGAGR